MADVPISIGGPLGGPGPLEDASGRGPGRSAEAPDVDFQDVLRDTIRDVDRLQNDAETAVKKMAAGEAESVAEVMTAVEKADLAFRTLMEVRNKLVDAYEELLRMRF